jgi:hypothetical protein
MTSNRGTCIAAFEEMITLLIRMAAAAKVTQKKTPNLLNHPLLRSLSIARWVWQQML